MAVKVRKSSRLIHADLRSEADFEFWELPEYPEIQVRNDDIIHQVEQTDRIDTLAQKYYGDPILWWVIALANDMKNPPLELNAGDSLRIPSPEYVNTSLLTPR